MKTFLSAGLLLLATATQGFAHDYTIGDLKVEHPVAFSTAATARTGGGFLTITNNGSEDDRLLSVVADFPRVEIHTFEMDGDVAKMMHMEDGLEIPAGETVMLAPGGLHVMFMGLSDGFSTGDAFDATLVFESAGELEIQFNIEDRPENSGHADMDHSNHGAKDSDS